MKKYLKNFALFILPLFLQFLFVTNSWSYSQNQAKEILKKSNFYYLIDLDSEEILLKKNIDVAIAPSSMTKLMTAYVVFDQIKKGNISLDKICKVGKDAWKMGGSSMFLNIGDQVTIEELLIGLLVVSGNDASIALADSVSGSENNFVDLMNKTAKKIGLKNSNFRNPNGLNEKNHYMTLRDLGTLSVRIYKDFPEFVKYLSIPKYSYGNIMQNNRNPLIKYHYAGAIGGKTGYTDDGGYGVVGVVKRNHRRLIGVINKANNVSERKKAITTLFDYGFNDYKKLVLFRENEVVANLKSWLGSEDVEVVTNKEISLNLSEDKSVDDIKVRVEYKGPIYAPIKKNQKVGDLIVEVKNYKSFKYALYSKSAVKKAGFFKKVKMILKYKVSNFINKIL